ncbi:Peroxisomal biogenesis factor 11 [Metarhizium album ARSEF 1941]|uniref:Peroxisomal biogenesis factor 11 n=1 Tax=Metarhizium album (strain ARSEF 1941) TaxID=1081103 RepID=A0A0B2WZQ2_METAS|nr:Peroxisomal biogenesis factor 11 [Metarhizium album ARSEF 1941]KHN99069.1 Peroxisomal biogenesis factor 11 [Metarhizium album ARSEF 1941]
MVVNTLVYHPSVKHYLGFVATTVGRDKLLRTVQYFARFYAWYLLRTNATRAQIAPWDVTKKQLGLTRKILRVGKNVEHLRAAVEAADNPKPVAAFLRYAAVGRQIGYAGYLTLDSAAVPDAAGIKKWDGAKTLQAYGFRFWALGLVFSISAQLYTLHQLNRREASIDRKDGEGVINSRHIARERTASRLQLISDLCDLTVPSSALGWAAFDDGFVGLAGTLSSLIGVYNQWNKVTAKPPFK